MARGIARRQRRSAWCSSPTSRPPSTGLCRGNSGGRFVDDMEPHPAGWGICALAVSLLLPPAHLPAQRLRQAAPPKGSIAAGATVQDSLVRRDVLLAAESTYAQQWKLTATAGQIVTIDLVSEAFDAYTFLLGPGLDRPPPARSSGRAARGFPPRCSPTRATRRSCSRAWATPDSWCWPGISNTCRPRWSPAFGCG